MLLRLFIAAVWSPAGKELTSWLSFSHVVYLVQVWYLIVSIPDLCQLSYFVAVNQGLLL